MECDLIGGLEIMAFVLGVGVLGGVLVVSFFGTIFGGLLLARRVAKKCGVEMAP